VGIPSWHPTPVGVIIPLLSELDPSDTAQLYRNWDAAQCLKWRHASDIRFEALSIQSAFPGAPALSPFLALATQVRRLDQGPNQGWSE
jgi:hypothetical protein